MNEINEKGTKKIFSRIGVALCVIFLVSTVMQVVWVYGLGQIPGIGAWLTESSWGMWLGTFVPMYLIGVPVGLLIFNSAANWVLFNSRFLYFSFSGKSKL